MRQWGDVGGALAPGILVAADMGDLVEPHVAQSADVELLLEL